LPRQVLALAICCLSNLLKKVKVITGKFTPKVGCVKYDRNKSITERERR